MKKNISYDTVSEAINDLAKRGYTTDFEILKEEECLVCNQTAKQLAPEEFEIDETYRFEGDSDPGDEMIVFAISAKKQNIKGIAVNGYGADADTATAKIVEKLLKKKKKTPIKRNTILQPISREHHHTLLLSWKIRTGIKKGIELERIKSYADWFYQQHILPHFEIEEQYLFPVLGSNHELVKRALSEHRKIKRLFEAENELQNKLSLIEEVLESHIRFEERVLFNEIQAVATAEQLKEIELNHTEEKFEDNMNDPFWL